MEPSVARPDKCLTSSNDPLLGDSLFRLIIEACPDIIYLYDRVDQRYLFVSGRSSAVLGYTPEQIKQLTGRDIEGLIHPDDLNHAQVHYAKQEMLADRDVSMAAYRVLNASGDYRLLRCRQKVFSRSPNGAVKCILGVATDITDEARRKREIEALRTLVLHIRDDERHRIALLMHDTAMQHLVGAALLLKGVEENSAGSVGKSLGEARSSLSRALREMLKSVALM